MEIVILASGSKGNAVSIKSQNKQILVDIGITYRTLKSKAIESDLNLTKIEDVLITHEHIDHVKGLLVFSKNHSNVNYYMTEATFNALDQTTKANLKNIVIIESDNTFSIDNYKISTFKLSHDAADPIGYVIESNNKKIVIATDTGYIDEAYFSLLKAANLYVLEANHEPGLLMDSRRPYQLKQRILGPTGHLSNNEAAWLINEFIKDSVEATWAIAHISEDCNNNYLIEKAIVNILDDPTKIKIIYTSQDTSEKIIL